MKNFKTFILVLTFVVSTTTYAQQPIKTDTFFSPLSKRSLEASNGLRVQHTIFFDPFGTPPNGEFGFQKGYQIELLMVTGLGSIFESVYAGASTSIFNELEGGYVDIVGNAGLTFHMFHTTGVRYYLGGRAGMEYRDGTRYEMAGLSFGFDVTLISFNEGATLYIGLESNHDYRESQKDENYGDSSVDKTSIIFTNSAVTINNRIRLGISF